MGGRCNEEVRAGEEVNDAMEINATGLSSPIWTCETWRGERPSSDLVADAFLSLPAIKNLKLPQEEEPSQIPPYSLPLSASSSSSSSGFSSSAEMEGDILDKPKSSAVVWDCGSTLYDSFELNSFKRQLDSAIASRTLSMPHLPGRRCVPPQLVQPPPPPSSKRQSKISRSLNKLLRSVFRQKPNSNRSFEDEERGKTGFYVLYGDEAGSLSAIPEVEFGGFSPEIGSLVRRTASERFSAASIGISCA